MLYIRRLDCQDMSTRPLDHLLGDDDVPGLTRPSAVLQSRGLRYLRATTIAYPDPSAQQSENFHRNPPLRALDIV